MEFYNKKVIKIAKELLGASSYLSDKVNKLSGLHSYITRSFEMSLTKIKVRVQQEQQKNIEELSQKGDAKIKKMGESIEEIKSMYNLPEKVEIKNIKRYLNKLSKDTQGLVTILKNSMLKINTDMATLSKVLDKSIEIVHIADEIVVDITDDDAYNFKPWDATNMHERYQPLPNE